MRHVNKGFLLIDSLITVFVTSLVCILCYSIFKADLNYQEGYANYQAESNDRLVSIFKDLNNCETCEVIDDSD